MLLSRDVNVQATLFHGVASKDARLMRCFALRLTTFSLDADVFAFVFHGIHHAFFNNDNARQSACKRFFHVFPQLSAEKIRLKLRRKSKIRIVMDVIWAFAYSHAEDATYMVFSVNTNGF